jgi:hypothetical protein
MTNDDLRAAAEAATPGPWEWIEPHSVMRRSEIKDPEVLWPIAAIDGLFSKRHANGEYIALASPDRILTLLDRVAELEKPLESLLEWAEGSEQIWMADLPSRMAQELDGIVDLARAALRKDR